MLTLDEEDNIGRCLSSLMWCDEVVVVDSGSCDRTCDIAVDWGARVCIHRPDPPFRFADQRNWALDNAGLSTEWVLFVDADEVIPGDLAAEIKKTCGAAVAVDALQLAPKYMFWGRWMRRSMSFPSWHDRLVRRGHVRFDGGVWEHFEAGTRVGRIYEPYIHYGNSKGFSEWLARHNRYSSWDAESIADYLAGGGSGSFRTGRKLLQRRIAARLWLLRPLMRFALMYVIRGGFRDGPAAAVFCLRYSVYEYMTVEKIIEIRRRRRGQEL